jgi:hypothetical protein
MAGIITNPNPLENQPLPGAKVPTQTELLNGLPILFLRASEETGAREGVSPRKVTK